MSSTEIFFVVMTYRPHILLARHGCHARIRISKNVIPSRASLW
ncbi:hypothetical protein BIS44_1936 [Mycobacterium tuberculosis variant bovis BCG]|nr:hypothetical protein BIS44_1936 [Mycobacterium tuberculosis variant bovis BCG]